MPDLVPSPDRPDTNEEILREFEHPRGTLVIVAVFAVLLALGWLIFYFYLYLGRGGTH
jgi:hypothetical protein